MYILSQDKTCLVNCCTGDILLDKDIVVYKSPSGDIKKLGVYKDIAKAKAVMASLANAFEKALLVFRMPESDAL